jgi:very-short-patch-repair endonuclease
VIEVDGGIHQQQQDYDAARTEWLTQRGFRVIRFSNEEVLHDLETVLQKIAKACKVIE